MKQTECLWKPDFDKWYNVNKSAYEFILKQSEIRHEDVLLESESITNKSIKIASSLVALLAFFIGYVIQRKIETNCYIIWFGVFSIVDITMSIYLLFPKNIKGRGFSPKDLLPEKLDNLEDRQFQDEILYYSAIVKLQDKIDCVKSQNESRAMIYLITLILALVLFATGTIGILTTL